MKRIKTALAWLFLGLALTSCTGQAATEDHKRIEKLIDASLPEGITSARLNIQQITPAYKEFYAYIKLELSEEAFIGLMTNMKMELVPKTGLTKNYSVSQGNWNLLYKDTHGSGTTGWWNPSTTGKLSDKTYARRLDNKLIVAKYEHGFAFIVIHGEIPQ